MEFPRGVPARTVSLTAVGVCTARPPSFEKKLPEMYGTGQTASGRQEFDSRVSRGVVMITTKSLRHFADDCLAWALKQDDPNQKQSIITQALSWEAAADAIDRRSQQRRGEDLTTKLN